VSAPSKAADFAGDIRPGGDHAEELRMTEKNRLNTDRTKPAMASSRPDSTAGRG
jgi:hypothetical protein